MMYRTPGAKHFAGSLGGNFGGIAQLGESGTYTLNSGLKVNFGFNGNGSGLTIHMENDRRKRFDDSFVHELAHYLTYSYNGIHPYTSGANTAYWGIFGGNHGTNSVNAYEKELLGWIDSTDITEIQMGQSYTLPDFLENKDVLKYEVEPGEYYYFENHQRTQSTTGIGSTYDIPNLNDTDKGIFVLHVEEPYLGNSSLSSIVSDGTWDWDLTGWGYDVCAPPGYYSEEPIYKKGDPNQFGESFKEPLGLVTQPYGGKTYNQRLYIKDSAPNDCKSYFFGFDTEDKSGFNKNRVPLVSSHTNPVFLKRDGTPTGLSMKITGESSGNITLKFYENYDPYSITENTTWDGQILLEQTTNIDNNATLTILPGTTVYLSENVILRAKPGTKIIAEGTQNEPIRFMRADPYKKWNKIDLRSSAGNSFEWVVFDGGDKNVDIVSKNNSLKHITSRNGWRGISTWQNADGSGNASAEISYALIEDNTSVGVVSFYTDLDMSYTTIRKNAQAGIYISSSTIHPFHNNIVTTNGQVETSRDGIEVTSSGTLYLLSAAMTEGYNEISSNPDDQISGSGSMYLGFPYGGDANNSITGNYSGTKYLVDNNSGVTVDAYKNYWGNYPTSSMFDGNVVANNFLYSDPTATVPHGHGGQTPGKVRSEGGDAPFFAEVYQQAVSRLHEAKSGQEIRDELYALYTIAGISGDSDLKRSFESFIKEVSEGRKSLSLFPSSDKVFQNMAKVLRAKSLVRDQEYGKLAEYLNQADIEVLDGIDRRDWLHLVAVSQTYQGEYAEALQTIESFKAHQKAQGIPAEDYEYVHQTLEEDIRLLLKEEADPEAPKTEDPLVSETDSQELMVQNYPNPFNPNTNISFTLPNKSNVTLVVYDMLGREVATLVNGVLSAGQQTVTFDATNLSNGMYLYKLQAGEHQIVKKMTLIK